MTSTINGHLHMCIRAFHLARVFVGKCVQPRSLATVTSCNGGQMQRSDWFEYLQCCLHKQGYYDNLGGTI